MALKVSYIGLRQWIGDFLTERLHCTRVNNVYAEYDHIRSGVVQGSCLGLLLFLIYINNSIDCFDDKVNCHQFWYQKKADMPMPIGILTDEPFVSSQSTRLTDGQTEFRQQERVLHCMQSHAKTADIHFTVTTSYQLQCASACVACLCGRMSS